MFQPRGNVTKRSQRMAFSVWILPPKASSPVNTSVWNVSGRKCSRRCTDKETSNKAAVFALMAFFWPKKKKKNTTRKSCYISTLFVKPTLHAGETLYFSCECLMEQLATSNIVDCWDHDTANKDGVTWEQTLKYGQNILLPISKKWSGLSENGWEKLRFQSSARFGLTTAQEHEIANKIKDHLTPGLDWSRRWCTVV